VAALRILAAGPAARMPGEPEDPRARRPLRRAEAAAGKGIAALAGAVILAVEDYESLIETLQILSDPQPVAEIRQAESRMREGVAYDEAQIRAALAARRA
jgi:hypothetical protein